MPELSNRVALVTGGSRGIGRAIALALAKAGAAVAINYRERGEEAAAVVEAIRQSGGRAAAVAADVSQAEAVQRMATETEDRLGRIDVLVNNAGAAATRGLDDITEEDFDHALAVNLKSAFLCTQAVLPSMRARRWGRIVNISSIGARVGAGSVSVAYGAAKAGLEGLTRAYALRLAPEGVTVNAIAPGLIDTEMGAPLIAAGVGARIPIGRVGVGDDIARAVLFLISDSFVTGQTLAVNGGALFSRAPRAENKARAADAALARASPSSIAIGFRLGFAVAHGVRSIDGLGLAAAVAVLNDDGRRVDNHRARRRRRVAINAENARACRTDVETDGAVHVTNAWRPAGDHGRHRGLGAAN